MSLARSDDPFDTRLSEESFQGKILLQSQRLCVTRKECAHIVILGLFYTLRMG